MQELLARCKGFSQEVGSALHASAQAELVSLAGEVVAGEGGFPARLAMLRANYAVLATLEVLSQRFLRSSPHQRAFMPTEQAKR